MLHLKPSETHYSQDSISNVFDSKSRHPNVFIGQTLDDLIEERIDVSDIPVISAQKIGDKWVSADNRRLWVFKHLEKFGKCKTIPVKVVGYIPLAKHTTTNDGMSVKIRGGGNPGGKYYFVLQVLEKILNDRNTEKESYETKIKEFEKKLDRSNVRCLQLRDANTKLLRENEDGKARSEELRVKLDRLTETNQRFKTAYEETVTEQRAKTASLTDKLKNTLVKLSKSEENYESSLANLRIETERLEDKIKELESQLTNSKKGIRQWAEAYKNMESEYKEKLRGLESNNESLRRSQSVTVNAENEANLQIVSKELERMNENYSTLQRQATKIHTSDKTTISKLQKENGKIQEENEKLKQEIAKKDKQMTEIRRRIACLYGLVQKK